VRITYSVGQQSFGPFPPSRAVDGIRPSVIALRMAQESRE
jgi:hypothetical protein